MSLDLVQSPIDDEAPIREMTKLALEAYNYRTIAASDGIEAIAMYAEHQHDVAAVLMDMMMPSMDGATAIRALQRLNPLIQIVGISGIATTEVLAQAAGSGVQAFLPKPCTAQELLTALRNVLGVKKDRF